MAGLDALPPPVRERVAKARGYVALSFVVDVIVVLGIFSVIFLIVRPFYWLPEHARFMFPVFPTLFGVVALVLLVAVLVVVYIALKYILVYMPLGEGDVEKVKTPLLIFTGIGLIFFIVEGVLLILALMELEEAEKSLKEHRWGPPPPPA